MGERSGNLVRGPNRDMDGANSTMSLRLSRTLCREVLGDTAMDSKNYEEPSNGTLTHSHLILRIKVIFSSSEAKGEQSWVRGRRH